MEVKYKRGLDHTYLVLEVPCLYEEDYQLKMIQANAIDGLLMVHGQGLDGKSQYFYEISGKTSLRALFEKREMKGEELEKILSWILKAVNGARKHMLDVGKILLSPEYIFYEDNKYYFCYLPARESDLCQEFHVLTEYFVRRINHQDTEGMQLAYELHKLSMEENYNLGKIIGQLKKRKKKKEIKKTEEIKVEEPLPSSQEENWGTSVIKESFGWQKKGRKDKWGRWH